MAANFETPREHSRIIAGSYHTPTPWTKIILAFAAGLVCAVLVVMAGFAWPKAGSDQAKVTADQSRVALAKKSATTATQAPKVSSEVPAQREAEPGDATRAGDGATPGAAAQAPDSTAQEDPCARETWPYVSQNCAAKQRTRSVRVIPTDRTAPQSIVTAAPEPASGPKEAQGSAAGAAPGPAATASTSASDSAAAPARATDGNASPQTSVALPPAPAPSAPSPNVAVQTAEPVPMPPPKPDTVARTEPETTGSAPATEPVGAVMPAPAVQESRSSRKSRERHDARERRDARTASRRDNARTNGKDDLFETTRDTREVRESSDEPAAGPFIGDEPRIERSRNQDQATRASRSRRIEVGHDESTRSTRRRDERRVVIERTAEPERAYVREDKPKLPFPFFFLGGKD
jgi:hypothetical protein